jgi:CheY-like chemotaxis protein
MDGPLLCPTAIEQCDAVGVSTDEQAPKIYLPRVRRAVETQRMSRAPELLLTDIIMPEMRGRARTARAADPARNQGPLIEYLAHLAGQAVRRERFLQHWTGPFQSAVIRDRVWRVPRHVERASHSADPRLDSPDLSRNENFSLGSEGAGECVHVNLARSALRAAISTPTPCSKQRQRSHDAPVAGCRSRDASTSRWTRDARASHSDP